MTVRVLAAMAGATKVLHPIPAVRNPLIPHVRATPKPPMLLVITVVRAGHRAIRIVRNRILTHLAAPRNAPAAIVRGAAQRGR